MSTQANYAATPRIGRASVGLADTSRVSPVRVENVFTAGANGSRIDNIDIVGMGTTVNAQVRLWKFDGTNYTLWREVSMSATTPSDTVSVATVNLNGNDNSFLSDILPSGYSLRASISATQTGATDARIDNIAASQAVSANVNALINGALAQAASTTSVAAGATQAGAAFYTLTANPVVNTVPALVSLTSTGNISAVNFTITGTNAQGTVISETLSGPNNNTVFTANPFASVTSVFCSAAVGTSTSIGVATAVAMTKPAKLTMASIANLTAINFTIVGINELGATVTETLAGGAAGAVVQSVNTYAYVSRITPNAAVSQVSFGATKMPFGFMITARGGDF